MRTNEWHVVLCACGQVTLQLGHMQIQFSHEEFAQLHRLVGEAMTEFRIPPSDLVVARIAATTTH